jgi:hypothetical protein
MAAYHKVEVSLNTNAVEVGIPSPQTVNVVVPTIGPAGPTGSVGPVGPTGPQGVPGTGLEVLTTQGDILYQGASTGQRLAIGTSGQVLKVANGIPAWANESGAVTSVNGETGAVTVNSPTILTVTSATTLTASRWQRVLVTLEQGQQSFTITLPTTSPQVGDRVEIETRYVPDQTAITISTSGFGTFLMATGERAMFIYSTIGPSRWLKLYENVLRPDAPLSTNTNGTAGSLAYDGTYLYVWVSANAVRRVPVASWS